MSINNESFTTTAFHGALAGIVAKTFVSPFDRLKIMFQSNHIKFTWHNLYLHSKMVINKEGGFHKLWKSNGIQLLRVAPNASLTFSFQRYYRSLLTDRNGNLSTQNGYLVGLLTGITSSALVYPLDTLKSRVAVNISKESTTSIIKNNITTQGIKSLYNGFSISTMSVMPYSSLSWGTFYFLNKKLQSYNNTLHDESHTVKAVAVASSVFFAQTVVYPLDVCRRRIQVNNGDTTFMNQIQIFKNIIREKSYFKGLSINFIKTPMANTISFITFSLLQST